MAKTSPKMRKSSVPATVAPVVPAAPDIRWALPMGLTVVTEELVDVTRKPSPLEMQQRAYRYVTEIIPRVRQCLIAGGFNIPDDIDMDAPIPVHSSGTICRLVYPPTAPVSKNGAPTSADGSGVEMVHPEPIGPLAGRVEPSNGTPTPTATTKRNAKRKTPEAAPPTPVAVAHPSDAKPQRKRKH